MSVHVWEHIVKMIDREQNPTKVAELAKELSEAILTEEKERVQRRLGITGRNSHSIVIR